MVHKYCRIYAVLYYNSIRLRYHSPHDYVFTHATPHVTPYHYPPHHIWRYITYCTHSVACGVATCYSHGTVYRIYAVYHTPLGALKQGDMSPSLKYRGTSYVLVPPNFNYNIYIDWLVPPTYTLSFQNPYRCIHTPHNVAHYTPQWGSLHHIMWLTTPHNVAHYTPKCGSLHHIMWLTTPHNVAHYTP